MRVRGLGDGSNGLTKCEGERGVLLCRGLLITLSVWVGIISLSLVPYPDIGPLCEHTHTHTQKHTHNPHSYHLPFLRTFRHLLYLSHSYSPPACACMHAGTHTHTHTTS